MPPWPPVRSILRLRAAASTSSVNVTARTTGSAARPVKTCFERALVIVRAIARGTLQNGASRGGWEYSYIFQPGGIDAVDIG